MNKPGGLFILISRDHGHFVSESFEGFLHNFDRFKNLCVSNVDITRDGWYPRRPHSFRSEVSSPYSKVWTSLEACSYCRDHGSAPPSWVICRDFCTILIGLKTYQNCLWMSATWISPATGDIHAVRIVFAAKCPWSLLISMNKPGGLFILISRDHGLFLYTIWVICRDFCTILIGLKTYQIVQCTRQRGYHRDGWYPRRPT